MQENEETVQTLAYADDKDRPVPADMTERAMLVEILTHMRTVADVLEDLADSPMVQALQNGSNPLMAMFGR